MCIYLFVCILFFIYLLNLVIKALLYNKVPLYIADEDVVDNNLMPIGFNKACVKNVFTVILVLIYLLLTTVAVFLAYQTISDFMEKLKHPVMSVSYKEVEEFAAPGEL